MARARAVVRASVVLCLAIMCACAIAIIVAAHPLVAIFDVESGSALEWYAVDWMRILGITMAPAAINLAMMGVLQGSGATRTSLNLNVLSTLFVQVPVAALLGFGLDLGATGVWLSFPIGAGARALLNWGAYRRGAWAVTGVRIPVREKVGA